MEKLKLREKVGFGIGAVGKDMVYMLTASYVILLSGSFGTILCICGTDSHDCQSVRCGQ